MNKYKICEKCGAHLDHGEKCDCTENRNNKEVPDNKLNERAERPPKERGYSI